MKFDSWMHEANIHSPTYDLGQLRVSISVALLITSLKTRGLPRPERHIVGIVERTTVTSVSRVTAVPVPSPSSVLITLPVAGNWGSLLLDTLSYHDGCPARGERHSRIQYHQSMAAICKPHV